MKESTASAMGDDRIRYLVHVNNRWRWRPTARMRAAGFRLITLSRGTIVGGKPAPSAEDKARAIQLNDDWDRYRRGLPPLSGGLHRYPPGSVGEGYHRALQLRKQERANKGITWTAEQAARDDWPRAWRWLEPLLGDVDPSTVTPERMLEIRCLVAEKVSEGEAHRVIKVWRALWKKMAAFRYCDPAGDPSLMFANSAPAPRQAMWSEGEAVRLVKQAWREGYYGLAALLAVAWDSQLSPVDAREPAGHRHAPGSVGAWFEVARAKTGRRALATLSPRALRVSARLPRDPGCRTRRRAPIFRNRSGPPYTKDTLGDDFRAVRARSVRRGETRQLADFRRSGSVEALAGDVEPEKLSSKMANSLSASNRLHKTYAPVQLASVRDADAARQRRQGQAERTKTGRKCHGAGREVSHEAPQIS